MPSTVVRVLANKLISKVTILLDLYILLERNAFLILDQTNEGYSNTDLYVERDEYQRAIQQLETEIGETQGLIRTVLHREFVLEDLNEYLAKGPYEQLLKAYSDIEICKRSIAGLDLETYLLVDTRQERQQERQALSTKLSSASNAYKNWIKYE